MDIFCKLSTLIEYIQTSYDHITEIWKCENEHRINLKKNQIVDIANTDNLYNYILRYSMLLNEELSDFNLLLGMQDFGKVSSRIKTKNSIEDKIQRYKTPFHENGKIPIIKCLNDLMGVRIIIENQLTFECIRDYLDTKYNKKYKCIDSSKDGYKAVHVYIRTSNETFPWELQIWNECDSESNLISHKIYKQSYTQWEKNGEENKIEYIQEEEKTEKEGGYDG